MATEYKNPNTLTAPVKENSEKKFDPIVDKPAEIKQKSLWQRAWEQFFHYDGKTLSEHIVLDMLVPSLQDISANVFKNIIDSFFYGSATRTGGYSANSYDQFYGRNNRRQNYQNSYPTQYINDNDYRYILFDDYGTANYALDQLNSAISKYGRATVGDLLDLTRHIPDPSDYKHGWMDLRGARVVSAGGGKYRIDLPTPLPID